MRLGLETYLYEVSELAMASRHGSVDIREKANLLRVIEGGVPFGESRFALTILNQYVMDLRSKYG